MDGHVIVTIFYTCFKLSVLNCLLWIDCFKLTVLNFPFSIVSYKLVFSIVFFQFVRFQYVCFWFLSFWLSVFPRSTDRLIESMNGLLKNNCYIFYLFTKSNISILQTTWKSLEPIFSCCFNYLRKKICKQILH